MLTRSLTEFAMTAKRGVDSAKSPHLSPAPAIVHYSCMHNNSSLDLIPLQPR